MGKVIEIRNDELPLLLKVAMCETVLGFKRDNDRGKFRWEGTDLNTGQPMTYTEDMLPDFGRSNGLAIGLFIKFATDRGLVPSLWVDNQAFDGAMESPVHVEIAERVADKLVPRVRVSAPNLPYAVCRSACELYDIDMTRLHRSLFPGRYLLLVE